MQHLCRPCLIKPCNCSVYIAKSSLLTGAIATVWPHSNSVPGTAPKMHQSAEHRRESWACVPAMGFNANLAVLQPTMTVIAGTGR